MHQVRLVLYPSTVFHARLQMKMEVRGPAAKSSEQRAAVRAECVGCCHRGHALASSNDPRRCHDGTCAVRAQSALGDTFRCGGALADGYNQFVELLDRLTQREEFVVGVRDVHVALQNVLQHLIADVEHVALRRQASNNIQCIRQPQPTCALWCAGTASLLNTCVVERKQLEGCEGWHASTRPAQAALQRDA